DPLKDRIGDRVAGRRVERIRAGGQQRAQKQILEFVDDQLGVQCLGVKLYRREARELARDHPPADAPAVHRSHWKREMDHDSALTSAAEFAAAATASRTLWAIPTGSSPTSVSCSLR